MERSRRTRPGWRPGAVALGVAVALHAAAVATIDLRYGWPVLDDEDERPGDRDEPEAAALDDAPATGPVAFVALVDDIPELDAFALVEGYGDEAHPDRVHPMPSNDVTMPGARAVAHGGGGAGGPDSWTGRDGDDVNVRTQLWNGQQDYRLPRHGDAREARSEESIRRDRETGEDDRSERRRTARRGEDDDRAGADEADGEGADGAVARVWDDSDPFFPGESARREVAWRDGTTRAEPARAFVDEGAPSTEAARRGTTADTVHTASASDELDPKPIEFSRSTSGGRDGHGVAAAREGDGVSARSWRRRDGTAATAAAVERGAGRPAVVAKRQNPYFRRLYRRVDKRVQFPKALAYSLDQGEVIVQFRLAAGGEISGVTVAVDSGFDEFDAAVTSAVAEAAPFGPVPESVLDGRGSIVVRLPYAFRNRMIR